MNTEWGQFGHFDGIEDRYVGDDVRKERVSYRRLPNTGVSSELFGWLKEHTVDHNGGKDECWVCNLPFSKNAVGDIMIRRGRREFSASEFAYIHSKNEGNSVPFGKEVVGSCGVRNCVNPSHLVLREKTVLLELSSEMGKKELAHKLFDNILNWQDDEACWSWSGYCDKYGVARVYLDGKLQTVHKLMYEVFVGELVDGCRLKNCHKRENCMNYNHYEVVYPDAFKVDVSNVSVESNGDESEGLSKSKLLSRAVEDELCKRYEEGDVTYQVLAKEYGVSTATVGSIIRDRGLSKKPARKADVKRKRSYRNLRNNLTDWERVEIVYQWKVDVAEKRISAGWRTQVAEAYDVSDSSVSALVNGDTQFDLDGVTLEEGLDVQLRRMGKPEELMGKSGAEWGKEKQKEKQKGEKGKSVKSKKVKKKAVQGVVKKVVKKKENEKQEKKEKVKEKVKVKVLDDVALGDRTLMEYKTALTSLGRLLMNEGYVLTENGVDRYEGEFVSKGKDMGWDYCMKHRILPDEYCDRLAFFVAETV